MVREGRGLVVGTVGKVINLNIIRWTHESFNNWVRDVVESNQPDPSFCRSLYYELLE